MQMFDVSAYFWPSIVPTTIPVKRPMGQISPGHGAFFKQLKAPNQTKMYQEWSCLYENLSWSRHFFRLQHGFITKTGIPTFQDYTESPVDNVDPFVGRPFSTEFTRKPWRLEQWRPDFGNARWNPKMNDDTLVNPNESLWTHVKSQV
jgi:hypothetical protein